MAKFCTSCGKEISEGAAFCTECGAKTPARPVTETTEAVTEVKETKVETPAVHTAPAQTYQAQQTYAQPQTSYASPAPDPTNKVVGTGAFFGTMLLFALPMIGFLACIIMCFAPKNQNLKNFAKANLIWAIIGLIFGIVLIVAMIALGNSILNYINEAFNSGLGDMSGIQ